MNARSDRSCRFCNAEDVQALRTDTDEDRCFAGIIDDRWPIIKDHRLLTCADHHLSIGSLPADRTEFLLHQASETYDYGFVAFEHGSHPNGPSTGCIDHAHLHLLPALPSLTISRLVRWCGHVGIVVTWREFTEASQLADIAHRTDYLYFRDSSAGEFVAPLGRARSVPSQILRRWVAAELALPSWDWKLQNPGPTS